MDDALPYAVAIGDSVLYQELEDELVLLNMTTQQYYGLNNVGAQMWKSLMETGTVTATSDALGRIYDAQPSVIQADLEALVRDLLKAGLLKAS